MSDLQELELTAAKARRAVLRMVSAGRSGHLGGAFSSIDIITAIYNYAMNIDPADPCDPSRDRFLLSAGHKAMAQYAVLGIAGFFDEELFDTYGSFKTQLPGHPDMHKLPGVEANTGALGHGLAIASGMAMAMKLDGLLSRVFTVMGDGELPEGSNWEAAAAAAHYHLDNLVAFVDLNGLQISGSTSKVMNMTPVSDKFEAFGWYAVEIDGHDMKQITDVLDSVPLAPGKPMAVVSRTIKGKGIKHLENTTACHYWKPSIDELTDAIDEIDRMIADLEVIGHE